MMGVVSVETWRRMEEGRAAAVVDGLRKRLDRRESRDSAIFLRFGLEPFFFLLKIGTFIFFWVEVRGSYVRSVPPLYDKVKAFNGHFDKT